MSLIPEYTAYNQAIFLDRDGVINEAVVKGGKPYPPSALSDLRIVKGAAKALRELKHKGWILIIVTNQPDVTRGQIKKSDVEDINNYILNNFPITEIFTCYHDDKDKCNFRKPLPGAFFYASQKYSINLAKSFMVGDRWKDITAGKNAGCKTIFIDYNYKEQKPQNFDFCVNTLTEASNIILGENNEKN